MHTIWINSKDLVLFVNETLLSFGYKDFVFPPYEMESMSKKWNELPVSVTKAKAVTMVQ